MTGRVRRPRGSARAARWRSTALLVLTTAAVVSCGRSEGDPPAAQPASPASSTPPPSAGSEPPDLGPGDAVRTVVISDEAPSTTAGAPAWPDVLASELGAAGIPMSVVTVARDGAGFGSSPSFADLVAGTAEGSTQLVVLFDSRLDGSESLTAAAEDTATAVERAAPDALLVVVGPLTAESAGLAAATQRAGGTYVDPRAEGWPTDATQPELAELLRPHLEPIAEVLAASGANR
jgi:hypothetical protein